MAISPARGKIKNAAAAGKPIPEGWALDKNGRPTTDAAAALEGMLLPIAGHKGYGIGVVVEVFSALLTGGKYGKNVTHPLDDYDHKPNCGNSGGSEQYWQELLVAPLIDQPLSCMNYALLADSDNNRPYIDDAFAPEMLHPIADLTELPALNQEGLAAATHYVESPLSVEPAAERSPFHGRVWVLVGEQVYSASESFAVFCKETGFATLVGSQTGGDGIGALDPIFLQLPNSGLLVQFTMMFGLNTDGSSSEEAGTTPDLLSPGTEPPLITALRAIRETARREKPPS